MKRGLITLAVIAVYLLSFTASAAKIVFYESGAGAASITKDYKNFADELKRKGYDIATIEKGDLTKDKLENYDILVIMNPSKQFTTDEITAIIWFVLQKGKGLLINGGGQGKANQLTIIFGVTVDGGILIDPANQIPALKDRSSFTTDTIQEYPLTKLLNQGVSKIGFYKNSGLIVSGTSMCIAAASPTAYSDTGSFAAGSTPCLAAASKFGSGLAFTLSDPNLLANKYLNDFNNKNFGMNIIDWLSIPATPLGDDANSTDYILEIKNQRLLGMRLEQTNKQLTAQKDDCTNRYNTLNLQQTETQDQLTQCETAKIMGLDRNNWAIIVLGVCILMAAIFYSKKKSTDVKIKDEDILNELGYELEGGKGGPEAPKK